jgi:hypothetical protein
LFGALTLTLGLLVPGPARAQDLSVTITTGRQFTPGDVDPFTLRPAGQAPIQTMVLPLIVTQGNDLIHVNLDIDAHNITSIGMDGDGNRLFAGDDIREYEFTRIPTAHLVAGGYPFLCTTHQEMRGVLTVV